MAARTLRSLARPMPFPGCNQSGIRAAAAPAAQAASAEPHHHKCCSTATAYIQRSRRGCQIGDSTMRAVPFAPAAAATLQSDAVVSAGGAGATYHLWPPCLAGFLAPPRRHSGNMKTSASGAKSNA
mmetsp:Transcript_39626/g.117908  ORF Transcript_39626/g.117908 Transcript_39626/m.117908 type:complete len:126 (+) Transcript_39626:575-952(+)|eukprot:365104-Chlamydomonas_euryale.AAC.15